MPARWQIKEIVDLGKILRYGRELVYEHQIIIYHLESILLLPWSSRVAPMCQNGPPGPPEVLKWSPRMSKWRH